MRAPWSVVFTVTVLHASVSMADKATVLVHVDDTAWQLTLTEESDYRGTHEQVKISEVGPEGAMKWITNTKPKKPLQLIANIEKAEKLSQDLRKKPLEGQVEKTVGDSGDHRVLLIVDRNGIHSLKLLTSVPAAWHSAVLTMDRAASLRRLLTALDKHVAQLRKVQSLDK